MSTDPINVATAVSIHRAEGTTAAERYLTRLARRSFLSMWSYSNVHRKDRGLCQEICDLLVVFENHLLIFSDKDCVFPNTGDLDLDWSRWYRKAVLKSAQQIWGAERWILSHPENLFLNQSCTQPFPIDLPTANNIKIHRILVAHAASDRCKRELGGSGSLMIVPSIVGDQHCLKRSDGGMPFAVGQIDHSCGYVHIFDDTTLHIVLTTLDTISDFVSYLEKKERFIANGTPFFAAGEEDLLAWYLANTNEQWEHDFVISSDIQGVCISEGCWADFEKKPERKAQIEANKVSYCWDSLIETCSHHAFAGTSLFVSPPGFNSQEKVLRLLARENRTRRRFLAQEFLDFIAKTPASHRATRTIPPSMPDDPIYVFLVMPQLSSWSYEEYREARREFLQGYCLITKVHFPAAKDIVGIATESGRKDVGSEDVIYLDVREWTADQQAAADQVREEFIAAGHLNEYTYHTVRVKEYPDVPAPMQQQQSTYSASVMKGRDRNAPCPCGSGKKFKKCCGA